MAGVLELAQLVEDDGVAEVDVRSRGVDSELDAQRTPLALGAVELGLERPLGEHVDGADHEVVEESAVGHGSVLSNGYGRSDGPAGGSSSGSPRRAARPPWMIAQGLRRPGCRTAAAGRAAQATPRKRWPRGGALARRQRRERLEPSGREGGALGLVHRRLLDHEGGRRRPRAARPDSGARLVTRALKIRVPPASASAGNS